MRSTALTPEEYLANLEPARQAPIERLRNTILQNLPAGFIEIINYGMLGYAVPHSLYPAGYHCTPQDPLPFMGFASQKNFISLYHMGIYASDELLEWFTTEYPKHVKTKLDMGKSCIRFKKVDQIPYPLIAELCQKMTVEEWITLYEAKIKTTTKQ